MPQVSPSTRPIGRRALLLSTAILAPVSLAGCDALQALPLIGREPVRVDDVDGPRGYRIPDARADILGS